MNPVFQLRAAAVFRYALPIVGRLPGRGADGAAVRPGWIVALHAEDSAGRDRVGYGDVAPLDFGAETLARLEEEVLEVCRRCVEGLDGVAPAASVTACIRYGLASAFDDLRAGLADVPLHRWYADEASGSVYVNALCRSDTKDHEIDELVAAGYRCVKVKVGGRMLDQEARDVRRISARLRTASLRLDANRAWSMEEALEFADRIAGVPLDYIEEPLREPGGLGALYDRTGWPLALDESLREAKAPGFGETSSYGIDAAVLKPSAIGDPRDVIAWAEAARDVGIRPVISSSLESGVGLRSLAALAAHPLFAGEPAGLSTHTLYAEDACQPKLDFGARVDVDALFSLPVSLADDPVLVRRFS